MTLSITVLVMEGTGALQLVVPMMLAVFVAKIVGDSVSMGVYDLHIKIRGAPVLVSSETLSLQPIDHCCCMGVCDLHIKIRGAPVLVSCKTFLVNALQTIVGITAVSWACVAFTSI